MKISFFKNRFNALASVRELSFKEFSEIFKKPKKDDIDTKTYKSLSPDEQMEYKDCGAYVGGVFKDNRRKAKDLIERSIMAIDIDHLDRDLIGDALENILDFFRKLKVNTIIHSTRNYSKDNPRLRVLLELEKPIGADIYEAIARDLIEKIGKEYVDDTCTQASRLMFFPSICNDGEYYYEYIEGKPLSTSLTAKKEPDASRKEVAKKQQNPLEKKGLIGAICKAYRVDEIMDIFLSDIYEKGKTDNRYRLIGSKSVDGVVVYDEGLFMYSNHETDKAHGRELNAYDLLRVHFCEGLSDERSYDKLATMFENDKKVQDFLKKEANDRLQAQFNEPIVSDGETVLATDLDTTKKGAIKSTLNNYVEILSTDGDLRDTLAYDSFRGKVVLKGKFPWMECENCKDYDDYDENKLLLFIEKRYTIKSNDLLQRAVTIVSRDNKFNALADYLNSLEWDGVKRIDTLLADYLGADKDIYTAAVMRKALVAAVARALNENIKAPKFDYMTILSGHQGCGKSTFLSILGGEFFSDSLSSFVGKEASEQLRGVWIVEVAELAAMGKFTIEQIKNFITKVNDIYRESYARNTSTFQRRCVFFGTTNRDEFLTDDTGNRRFLPVKVGIHEPIKSVFSDLENERDMIFAEAMELFKAGESLKLNDEEEKIAHKKREESEEKSLKLGLIEEYLNRDLPSNWAKLSLFDRRIWLEDRENKGSVRRGKVCIAEIWCECIGKDLSFIKRADRLEIANSIRQIGGWDVDQNPTAFNLYGKQKGYTRLAND